MITGIDLSQSVCPVNTSGPVKIYGEVLLSAVGPGHLAVAPVLHIFFYVFFILFGGKVGKGAVGLHQAEIAVI